jgi:hypothetical protein
MNMHQLELEDQGGSDLLLVRCFRVNFVSCFYYIIIVVH